MVELMKRYVEEGWQRLELTAGQPPRVVRADGSSFTLHPSPLDGPGCSALLGAVLAPGQLARLAAGERLSRRLDLLGQALHLEVEPGGPSAVLTHHVDGLGSR